MFYRLKVAALKQPWLNLQWQKYRRWRGDKIGDYAMLPDLIRRHAPGKSFVDVGCMWGVNGEYAFVAEAAGATTVKGVDVFGPTPEFTARQQQGNSRVEFVLGDILLPATQARSGVSDVVFCAGVLYHLPSPFELLLALRRICRQTLILRSSTIPEMRGQKNMAVFWPLLADRERARWDLKSLGLLYQAGISDRFDPSACYSNWFWGLTPSCLRSLLRVAGFEIVETYPEAFAQTYICRAAHSPFVAEVPTEAVARAEGEEVSQSGLARPA